MFNLEYIKYVRLVAAIPEPVCCYIKRSGSLVSTQATPVRAIEMKRKTFACYKQLYQALDLYEEQKGQVYRYLIATATDGGSVRLPQWPGMEKRRSRPGKRRGRGRWGYSSST